MITVHVSNVGTRQFSSQRDANEWAKTAIRNRDKSPAEDSGEDECGRPAGVSDQQRAAYSPRSSYRVPAFLKTHGGAAKTSDVVASIGRSRSTVLRVLQVAVALKLVHREGTGTATTWQLIRKDRKEGE